MTPWYTHEYMYEGSHSFAVKAAKSQDIDPEDIDLGL